MSLYKTVTIDDRGPEPLIRIRSQVLDANDTVQYTLNQSDVERVHRFPVESVALKLFGDEDLAWVLTDTNDQLKHPSEWKIGDKIQIPKFWQRIVSSNENPVPTARTR